MSNLDKSMFTCRYRTGTCLTRSWTVDDSRRNGVVPDLPLRGH